MIIQEFMERSTGVADAAFNGEKNNVIMVSLIFFILFKIMVHLINGFTFNCKLVVKIL